MCPARNAHWYHPVTEQIEPGAICLHRCNASTRRVMHHSCASTRRAAHESCAVQRAARRRPARLRPLPHPRLARGSEISASSTLVRPGIGTRRSARGVLWNRGTPTGRPDPSPLASAERSRPARPGQPTSRLAAPPPGLRSRFRNLGISTLVRPGIGTSAERTRRVVEPRHADREARHTSTATVTSPTMVAAARPRSRSCGRVTAAPCSARGSTKSRSSAARCADFGTWTNRTRLGTRAPGAAGRLGG